MLRYTYVYIDTYMHVKTVIEKISHEFEGEWAREYGKVWKEERAGKM